MAIFETEILIQETDLDVFGHVNNAAYLRLLENVRWKHITDKGVGLKQIMQAQTGPVILEINIKFLKELKAREKIKVRSEFMPFKGKISQIEQVMINEAGTECCRALFTFAVFDIRARKIISPPDEWLSLV